MQAIGKSSIVVALVASVCVTLGVENAAGGSRCQIPASGAVSVYGPVGLPGNQATWKCPSFDPISGGPRHAYFVRKEKKGKKEKYKEGGYFVPTSNAVYTYKCKESLKLPSLCDK